MRRSLAVTAVAAALLLAACGSSTNNAASSSAPAGSESASPSPTSTCSPDSLETVTPGTLTVATGEPVFEPWVVGDKPESGEGFEAAVAYAVAEQLGYTKDQVTWIRTTFDSAIAPGPKDFDFNIQQYGITADRDEVVDFSDGYYTVQQAVVALPDSDVANAESVSDLQSATLGAGVGTTSLDYIEEVIQPGTDAAVFDDTAAASSVLAAGQVDGLVYDLPTAFYITAVEIPDASIVGILPVVGDAEELGMLFEEGSPLVPCVNEALAAVEESGDLAALQEEWLANGGETPTLSE